MATDLDELYERDFYAWTREQADALRRASQERLNTSAPIDWEHVAEEVEDLGNEQRRAILSQLERLIQHLLKLEYSHSESPRRQWLLTIDNARAEIDRRWSAAIAATIEPELVTCWRRARRAAALELADHGEADVPGTLPQSLPYSLSELRDEVWYPASRAGLMGE